MLRTIFSWTLGLLMMFAAAVNAADPGFTAGHLAWVVLGMGIILASYLSRIATAAEATAEELRELGDPAMEDLEPKRDVSRAAKAGEAAGRYLATAFGGEKGPIKKS